MIQSQNATELKEKKRASAGGKTGQHLEPFPTVQYQVPKCKHKEK